MNIAPTISISLAAWSQLGLYVLLSLGMLSFAVLYFRLFFQIRKKKSGLEAWKKPDPNNPLKTLIDNLPDSVYVKDLDGRYVIANDCYAHTLKKRSAEDIIGKTDADLYEGEQASKYQFEDQKLLSGDTPIIYREQESSKGKNKKHSITTKVPLRNQSGQIIGIIGVYNDITQQKLASIELKERSQVLEKERNLLRALIDNIPDTIYIKDMEGRFLDANPLQIEVTKAGSRAKILGKTDYDFYPKDIADIFAKDDKKVISKEEAVINKEEIGFDPEGNIRVRSTTKVPFYDEQGKIAGLVGIGRDITKLKETEEKLLEQAQSLQEINVLLEERQEEINQQSDELSAQNKLLEDERNLLRTLIDNIPDMIYIKDRQGHFLTCNKHMLDTLKLHSLEQLQGKTNFDLFPKDLAEKYSNDEFQVLQSGSSLLACNETSVDKDGNIIQQLSTKVPLKDYSDQIIGLVGIGRNITHLKETEFKLQEQADFLKEANILLEERQEEIEQQSHKLAEQNSILENERNLLRTLIDCMPDFVYIKDKESRFITANKSTIKVMKARSLKNLEGKTDFDFYGKDVAQPFYDDEQKIIKEGKPMLNKEELGFDYDGNERIISTSKVPFYDPEGNILGIVGVGRDITDSKGVQEKLERQAENLQEINKLLEERQAEINKQSDFVTEQNKKLEEEKNLLRALIDSMPDFIFVKDSQSRFITANNRMLEVLHAETVDKIVGTTDFVLAPNEEAAKQYFINEQKIIQTGKPMINKEEIGLDESGRERHLSFTKVPFRDSEKNIAGIVGIGRDITKQKQAEAKLREQAQNLQEINILLEERQEKIQAQAERLNNQATSLQKANLQLKQLNATKNKFFSIIAHDLKNPFQAIFGFSELLMRNAEDFDEEQRQELLAMIKTSSEGAFNLLENLLQWARTQTESIKYNPSMINVGDILEQNINLVKATAENKKISLLAHSKNNCHAFADANMINLVVRNLLSNAIKFTQANGQISLACFNLKDNQIAVSISDTGVGISEANLNKLFRIDEYFTTSGTLGEGGTGLGLIICREFVEKNKGELSVESQLNEGTTFTFTLPKTKAKS